MPVEALVKIASEYGAFGLVFLAAGLYIFRRDDLHEKDRIRIEDRHAVERKELTDALARQHSEALSVAERASRSLDNNTAIVSKLATMIEATSHIHR